MTAVAERGKRPGAKRSPHPSPLDLSAVAALDGPVAIAAVKHGLDAGLLRQMAERLEITLEELGRSFQLTPRTLHRRLEQGKLGLAESEKLLGLAKLLHRAVDILGAETKAVRWLKSPLPTLGGQAPLAYVETQVGLQQVGDVLTRIEDVVYS